ncbi:MAG: hypothetical protein MJZ03_03975 [archaeon]|nr:hypothetical protein [archaeon]
MIQFRKDVKIVPEYIYNEAKKVEDFLTELTELSRKHKISISGCGCCGSPYLDDAERDIDTLKYSYDNLAWVESSKGFYYEIDAQYSTGLVRISGRQGDTDD